MDSNNALGQLIAEYEGEIEFLKLEINHCVELSFFKEADKYFRALTYVTSTLVRLKSIEFPDYWKIEMLKRQYERRKFKKDPYVIEREKDPNLNTYFEKLEKEKIFIQEREMEDLLIQKAKYLKRPYIDSDTIISQIENLLCGRIKEFSLIFHDKQIIFFYYNFGETIMIRTTTIKNRIKKYTTKDGLATLKNMGFNIKKKNAEFIIPSDSVNLIHELHELSSRLVYDVFGLNQDKNVTLSY